MLKAIHVFADLEFHIRNARRARKLAEITVKTRQKNRAFLPRCISRVTFRFPMTQLYARSDVELIARDESGIADEAINDVK